jgi:hypothetical protein
MTGWEYRHFTGMVGYRLEHEEDPEARLTRLGAEGWELVAVHPVPRLGHMYASAFLYVLKRRVVPDADWPARAVGASGW